MILENILSILKKFTSIFCSGFLPAAVAAVGFDVLKDGGMVVGSMEAGNLQVDAC